MGIIEQHEYGSQLADEEFQYKLGLLLSICEY